VQSKARTWFIVFSLVLIFVSFTACERAPTDVKTVEGTTVADVTSEVEDTPQATPIPTAKRTPIPTVVYSIETVSFTTEDDLDLVGTYFQSEGEIAVVLAHMAGENDQKNWIPFAKRIANRGYTALTFNFRCYGESDCGGSESGSVLISRDIGAAIDFLRDRGFERIVCIGASMGGRACVNAAFETELAGLVIVSGTGSSDPERQDLSGFISPAMPKLFIVSESDHIPDRTLSMTRLHEAAPEPKLWKTFPGTAHGVELFDSKVGSEFRTTLMDFLAALR
jgi:dienelactone hydrolase